jgi:hypothetical protein
MLGSGIVQSAEASFHLMQIEQVIGGVDGDTSAQAIQLRRRFPGDGSLPFARMRAWDATGSNPITLIDFNESVTGNQIGDRIFVASPSFLDYTQPALAADFVLTGAIPESYLAAGRITYEGDDGVVYWSLSYGGDAYTGPTTGSLFNDADGDFGPSLGEPLPVADLRAFLFQGSAYALSTSNAADYALTTGPAIFTNNLGISSAVVPEPGTFGLLALGSMLLARRRRGI